MWAAERAWGAVRGSRALGRKASEDSLLSAQDPSLRNAHRSPPSLPVSHAENTRQEGKAA